LTLLLVLYSAPTGFSPGSAVFPSPQKPTFLNSNLIFSHEPLARVIAQALPVLDLKFHLHLHFFKGIQLNSNPKTSRYILHDDTHTYPVVYMHWP